MDLRNKKAFTVAEMLIVLFIMSIITIAFVPVITQKTKADAAAAKSGPKSVWQHVANSSDTFFSTASTAAGAIIGANSYADASRAKFILNTKDATQYQILFKQGAVPVELGHLTLNDQGNLGLGKTTNTGTNSTAIGVGTMGAVVGANALGNNSTALGAGTIANGALATAIGCGATAGPSSTALGSEAIASGTSSTTLGAHAKSSGNASTAVGSYASTNLGGTAVGALANATGTNSVSIGYNSSATGAYSVAIGDVSTANFDHTIAIGPGAHATAANQIVLGSGYVAVSGDLHLGGTIFLSGGPLVNTYSSGLDFLYLNTSDRRLKNIHGEFNDGLSKIGELKPYNYAFKKDKEKTQRVGVMAQDLQKVFPNAVIKDKQGNLMIRQEDIFFAMLNSIKQLDTIVQNIVKDFRLLAERFMEIDTKTIALAQVDKINDKRIKNIKSEDKSIEVRLKRIEKKLKSTK